MASQQARSSASLRISVLGSTARNPKCLGFFSCFPQDDERIRVILIRHGQTDGSPLAELRARWPDVVFDHLRDPWWPQLEETEEVLLHRSETYHRQIANDVWSDLAVVTHWGFIRALTGLKAPNGSVLRSDPTRPDREAEKV